MTTPARRYFAARAIDPRIAFEVGVRPGANPDELSFPNGRRRILSTGRVLQAKGTPLAGWWVTPAAEWKTALVCEGESDALAALTALCSTPESLGFRELPVLCVPGCGYPVGRLTGDLAGLESAMLAFDPDEAGDRYANEAIPALTDAGIRPIPVEVPERTRTELEETLTPTQQTVPHYVDRPENFDEWLIWLDQTCAAARRVGIESQLSHHRDQLAAWALRWAEEAA